jgi:hypothetical protein
MNPLGLHSLGLLVVKISVILAVESDKHLWHIDY